MLSEFTAKFIKNRFDAAQETGLPAIADDSGLEVDFLKAHCPCCRDGRYRNGSVTHYSQDA